MSRVSSQFAAVLMLSAATGAWFGCSVCAIIGRFLRRLFGRLSGRCFERRQPRRRIGRFGRTCWRDRGGITRRAGAARRRDLDGGRQRHHRREPDAKIRPWQRDEHRRSEQQRSAQPRQPAGDGHGAGQHCPWNLFRRRHACAGRHNDAFGHGLSERHPPRSGAAACHAISARHRYPACSDRP